ncbi:MAG: inner membrane CreD family protein [Thermomonas sp.]|nr:inner membrane CreD family protein [Thermomonas sp.]
MGFKAAMVVVLVLAILIPLAMIRGTIDERQGVSPAGGGRITRSYAGAQGLAGPVLVVPYREQVEVEERDATGVLRKQQPEVDGQWLFFPKAMTCMEACCPRSASAACTRCGSTNGRAPGRGLRRRLPAADPKRPRTLGAPWLDIGIADVRGLVGAPHARGRRRHADPAGPEGRTGGGVHAVLPQLLVAGGRIAFPVQFGFALRGTEALAIVPLADGNRIVLDSPWPHPQFNGDFLPRSHRIDGNGFHAEWDVSSLASNAQAQYRRRRGDGRDPAPGHDGVAAAVEASASIAGRAVAGRAGQPVFKVDRATKYGLLFVLLTFTGFFMFETIRQLPIHPIQYALVGLALAIFFLLLLSLSEHIAFGLAYSWPRRSPASG